MKEKETNFNFLRKLWHLLGLVIPLSLYWDIFLGWFGMVNATRAILVFLLALSLVLLGFLEFLRFRYDPFSRVFWKLFGPLMKENERNTVNATIPYFLANFFVILLFPAELAVISLAFLVIGDPFAAYIGTRYGKHRFSNGKSLEGILAFVVSSFAFGLLFLIFFEPSNGSSGLSPYRLSWSMILVLFFGSLSAGVTEFFSATKWKGFLDDNLLIPIVSCLVMGIAASWVFDLSWDQVLFPVERLLE